MGLNTAFQIARRSPSTKIKIFEQAPGPGYGSSGASSAICRVFYSFENQVMMARDGINLYRNWNDYLQYKEASAVYTRTGMLLMLPMTRTDVVKHQAKYSSLGISTSIVDRNTMDTRFPMINPDIGSFDNNGEIEWEPKEMDNDTYFFYEEDAGYFEPVQAITDLRNVLRDHHNDSVSMHYNSTVTEVLQCGGRVKGVSVSDGDSQREIHCDTVVNCSGPWYNKVIQDLDLDIKFTLTPVRIQVIYKDSPELFTEEMITSSCGSFGKEYGLPIPDITDGMGGVYIRPQHQSKQVLVSTTKEEEERTEVDPDAPMPSGADPEFRNKYLNSLFHRLEPIIQPTSAKVQSLNGIYTVCEDDVHYLIGDTKLKGFIVCNGFSGHGFKCGPSVGSMIAQHITKIKVEGDTDVPIDFYSPYREPLVLKVKNVLA